MQIKETRMEALEAESTSNSVSSPSVVFQAKGLTKTYQMGEVQVHALRGIDLELHQGEFIVMLGASGSGKSTLLNILGGLDELPGHPLKKPSYKAI